MADKGAEQQLALLQAARMVTCGCRQRDKIEECEVGQGVSLQVPPDHLHRVQLRSVGRKQDGVQGGCAPEELRDGLAPMSPEPVPDQDQRGMDLPSQLAKEVDHLGSGDVGLGMEAEVQVDLIAAGGYAQGSDDGDFLVGACALGEERCLASWGPGPSDKGGHQQAGLVDEDEPGCQAGGFFLTRGHSSFAQRWISASSRSAARRCGFCGLQPKSRRRRPTWSTW